MLRAYEKAGLKRRGDEREEEERWASLRKGVVFFSFERKCDKRSTLLGQGEGWGKGRGGE